MSALNFKIEGHNLIVTPPMRTYVESKLHKLSHFEKIMDIQVTLTKVRVDHKDEFQASAKIFLPSTKNTQPIFAETTDVDMYAAIDALVPPLDRQITDNKQKSIDNRRRNNHPRPG